MKGATASWKIFRAICIVQLILVAFKGMLSFSELFYKKKIIVSIIETIAYAVVFLFVYHGLSILNYNYPDVPLSTKQKRSFNLLYLANFLLIAFLFAQVVNTWWLLPLVFGENNLSHYTWFPLTALLLFSWIIFTLHLVFLGGMFLLRRQIYENTISSWYQQFDKKE